MRALPNQMSESSNEYEWAVVGAPYGSFTLNCGTPRRKLQRGFVPDPDRYCRRGCDG
jgi:hypothetical protein